MRVSVCLWVKAYSSVCACVLVYVCLCVSAFIFVFLQARDNRCCFVYIFMTLAGTCKKCKKLDALVAKIFTCH